MHIAKWGNSLAVRIPADVVRELGLKEGDDVSIRSAGKKAIEIERDLRRDEAIAAIRRLSVKFPPDYKFDREEANSR